MVAQLNTEVTFVSKANAMINPIDPKSGLLMVGDRIDAQLDAILEDY